MTDLQENSLSALSPDFRYLKPVSCPQSPLDPSPSRALESDPHLTAGVWGGVHLVRVVYVVCECECRRVCAVRCAVCAAWGG